MSISAPSLKSGAIGWTIIAHILSIFARSFNLLVYNTDLINRPKPENDFSDYLPLGNAAYFGIS